MNSIMTPLRTAAEAFLEQAKTQGKDLVGFAIADIANKVNAIVNNFFVGVSENIREVDEKLDGQVIKLGLAFEKALNQCQIKTRGEVDNLFDSLQQIVSQLPLTDKSPQVLKVSKGIFVNPGDTESIVFSGVFKSCKLHNIPAKLTIKNQSREEWDCRLAGNETDHKLVFEIPKAAFSKDLTNLKISKVRACLEIPLNTWFVSESVKYHFTFYAIPKCAGKFKLLFEETVQRPVVQPMCEQFQLSDNIKKKGSFTKVIVAPHGWQIVSQSLQTTLSLGNNTIATSNEVDQKSNCCLVEFKGKKQSDVPYGIVRIEYKITQQVPVKERGEEPEDTINFDETNEYPILLGTKRMTSIQFIDIFNQTLVLNIHEHFITPHLQLGCFTIKRENENLSVCAASDKIVQCIPGDYFKVLDLEPLSPLLFLAKALTANSSPPATPKRKTASKRKHGQGVDTQEQSVANSLISTQNLIIVATTISVIAGAIWIFKRNK